MIWTLSAQSTKVLCYRLSVLLVRCCCTATTAVHMEMLRTGSRLEISRSGDLICVSLIPHETPRKSNEMNGSRRRTKIRYAPVYSSGSRVHFAVLGWWSSCEHRTRSGSTHSVYYFRPYANHPQHIPSCSSRQASPPGESSRASDYFRSPHMTWSRPSEWCYCCRLVDCIYHVWLRVCSYIHSRMALTAIGDPAPAL